MRERGSITYVSVALTRRDIQLDVITTNEPFPAGEHVVEWLGKSNRGEYYKNGLYLVEIVSKDPIDNKSNRYVGRIVINK